MRQITTRVESELADEIDRRASEDDVSKSEVVRTLLRRGLEHEELERENERLRNRLQAVTERQEEHEELVRYVESEKTLQERREARKSAPLWERARYFVFGYDSQESDA